MAKKIKSTVIDTQETNDLEVGQQLAVEVSIADQSIMASYEVLKQVGRIESLEFLRRVGDLAIAKTFGEIKKTKQYKDLPYTDKDGSLRHVVNLDEFCQVFLGKSASRCYELSQNLNLLGEELYEQAVKYCVKVHQGSLRISLKNAPIIFLGKLLNSPNLPEYILDAMYGNYLKNQKTLL